MKVLSNRKRNHLKCYLHNTKYYLVIRFKFIYDGKKIKQINFYTLSRFFPVAERLLNTHKKHIYTLLEKVQKVPSKRRFLG